MRLLAGAEGGRRRRRHVVSARARARAEEAAPGAEEARGAPPPGEGQGEEAKEVGRWFGVISIWQRAPTYCVGPSVAADAHSAFLGVLADARASASRLAT